MPIDAPEWFTFVQAHVTAVRCNDTAVRLFRAGQLGEAITELEGGLEAYPGYATGHSNLGFLYLWKGEFEPAIESLLRALAVDPHHQDAPNHLFDVLRALTDELVQIGCADGFLSTQPGRKFDGYNRHIRTREIGALIARTGEHGVFKVAGQVLGQRMLMRFVINKVQQEMRGHPQSTNLTFAWDGIGGWHACAVIPLTPHAKPDWRRTPG